MLSDMWVFVYAFRELKLEAFTAKCWQCLQVTFIYSISCLNVAMFYVIKTSFVKNVTKIKGDKL